ncbi:PREDICTED: MICAL-like protein 1 [Chinchilla lanigera]|uniref:MICAL-like protein 1 n=1 Tax=Chinchilla lanigera TaxID=34839 RepID=UPI00038ECD59|nr:PREDICTED: MICAL-like protein 1 [Chinchilla lanigera]
MRGPGQALPTGVVFLSSSGSPGGRLELPKSYREQLQVNCARVCLLSRGTVLAMAVRTEVRLYPQPREPGVHPEAKCSLSPVSSASCRNHGLWDADCVSLVPPLPHPTCWLQPSLGSSLGCSRRQGCCRHHRSPPRRAPATSPRSRGPLQATSAWGPLEPGASLAPPAESQGAGGQEEAKPQAQPSAYTLVTAEAEWSTFVSSRGPWTPIHPSVPQEPSPSAARPVPAQGTVSSEHLLHSQQRPPGSLRPSCPSQVCHPTPLSPHEEPVLRRLAHSETLH